MEIRTYGDRTRTPTAVRGKSRTQQNMKQECDVNFVMSKWAKTGLMRHVTGLKPSYGDFTNVTDYLSASQAIIDAQDAFMSLGSKVRERFQNNPAALLAFLADPANEEEARELDLIPPIPTPPAIPKVEVINPTPAPSPIQGGE